MPQNTPIIEIKPSTDKPAQSTTKRIRTRSRSFGSWNPFPVINTPVPIAFHWSSHASKVQVCGSWTEWQKYYDLTQSTEGSNVFSAVIDLIPGIYTYKFVVDGEWQFADDQQQLKETNGIINNCVCVTSPIVYEIDDETLDENEDEPGIYSLVTSKSTGRLLHNQFMLEGVVGKERKSKLKIGLDGVRSTEQLRGGTISDTEHDRIESFFSKSKKVPSTRSELSQTQKFEYDFEYDALDDLLSRTPPVDESLHANLFSSSSVATALDDICNGEIDAEKESENDMSKSNNDNNNNNGSSSSDGSNNVGNDNYSDSENETNDNRIREESKDGKGAKQGKVAPISLKQSKTSNIDDGEDNGDDEKKEKGPGRSSASSITSVFSIGSPLKSPSLLRDEDMTLDEIKLGKKRKDSEIDDSAVVFRRENSSTNLAKLAAKKSIRKELNQGDTTKMVLSDRRLVIVMIGLPARGKSFISGKLARYLQWLGYSTKVFNYGTYRRNRLGSFHNHDFFRHDNPEGVKARFKLCKLALLDMEDFLLQGGRVGILDGTNHTSHRRNLIVDEIRRFETEHSFSVKTMFLEVICNMPHVINENISRKISKSPDYTDVDPAVAMKDFTERIKHYENAYETLNDKSLSYFKLYNVGQETVTNRIYGVLPTRIVFYLMNLHIQPRTLYLSRQGECVFNKQGKMGGDSPLTDAGIQYAKELAKFMSKSPEFGEKFDPEENLCVWSSTMVGAIQTSEYIPHVQIARWKALEEIDVGDCNVLTKEEFKEQKPYDFEQREKNKLTYRYPGAGGESFEDLIARLEPVIIELERQTLPVLVIAHEGVLRCLLAYFLNLESEEIPYLDVPIHQVIKIVPTLDGHSQHRYNIMKKDDPTIIEE